MKIIAIHTMLLFVLFFFPLHMEATGLDEQEEKETIIVEVDGDLEEIKNRLEEIIPTASCRYTYEETFRGFSVQLEKDQMEKLSQIPGVKHAVKAAEYEVAIDESVPFIGAEAIRNRLDEHGVRLTGRGVKIGIIDTGIDYNHPDLSKNYKKGYDIIDDDDDPMETKDNQGMPTLHGTHVAGIIAANGAVRGVAPDAELYVYRALGPGGQGSTEQVLAAIEQAVKDGVDIINLSLGSPVNGPDWPTSKALDKAVEQGVIAITSNGNSGPDMWSVGSPGTSRAAISVGASIPPLRMPHLAIFGEDGHPPILPLTIQGAKPWALKRDFPIVYGGIGMKKELENTSGKIVLIERGGIATDEKLINAKKAGAAGVIIFNDVQGPLQESLDMPIDIVAATVSKEDGLWMKKLAEREEPAYLRTIYLEETDHMASFSSRGPVTRSWEIKPDVVAPGVDIDSTVPKGYLALNGTSMAAPHVAGAVALLKQAKPEWTPEQMKAALMNTAIPLTDESGEHYPPFVQGAGRIDITKALTTDVLVMPGSISFGVKKDTDDRTYVIEKPLTIANHSNETKTFRINAPDAFAVGIRWQLPLPIVLKPGQKEEVTIGLEIEMDLVEFQRMDGVITVEGGKEPIDVPFIFFADEPDYPRIGAFQLSKSPEGIWGYELFVPGGAKEYIIALYDPVTNAYEGILDRGKDIKPGLVEKELREMPYEDGWYVAIVYVYQEGQEDAVVMEVLLES